MAARRAGCIARVDRHSSPKIDTACPSESGSHKPSSSCRRLASSSRSHRRASLLGHPKQWRQIMSEFDELPETFGNGTYLLAVCEILSNEHKGRRVYQNVTLQNVNQQAVEIGQRLLTDIYTA